MHETPDELETLQALLDRSYELAGEHLQSIHTPQRRMSAIEVCDVLKDVRVLNLATVNQSDRPFVAPIDGLFLGGHFWFGSSSKSQRFRHIRHNPNVSGAYTDGEDVSIIVHGAAREIDTSTGDFERLHHHCREIYGSDYDSWGYWEKEPFAWIEPTRMYAIQIRHSDSTPDA